MKMPHNDFHVGTKFLKAQISGKMHFGMYITAFSSNPSNLRLVFSTNTELSSTSITELMSTTEFSSNSELSSN